MYLLFTVITATGTAFAESVKVQNADNFECILPIYNHCQPNIMSGFVSILRKRITNDAKNINVIHDLMQIKNIIVV